MAAPADAGRDARGRATQGAVAETAVPLERIAVNRKAAGTVAVVGNPNAGKSSVFNRLTGLRQHTANYPGVTVERRVGRGVFGRMALDLIDLPGTYSLSPTSADEQIAVDVLFGRVPGTPQPNAILAVIDSTRLYQGLYLLQQLVELGRPMIVALTMIDAAEREGLKFDFTALEEALGGVPVLPVVATSGRGFRELNAALARILTLPPPRDVVHWPELRRAADALVERWRGPGAGLHRVEAERLLIDANAPQFSLGTAAGAELAAARTALFGAEPPLAAEARRRYAWVRATLSRVESPGSAVVTQAARLVDWINRPWPGLALLIVVMFVMFQAVFAWATPLVDLIDAGFAGLGSLVAAVLPDGIVESFIVAGVIAGVGSVIVFLPQILILFLFINLAGGHGLPRARGVPRRPRDAQRRAIGSVRDPVAVELRLRRAVDHGDARDPESSRPHRDDPRRAVHDLLGALARLRAADRCVRAGRRASAFSTCRASCCSACYVVGIVGRCGYGIAAAQLRAARREPNVHPGAAGVPLAECPDRGDEAARPRARVLASCRHRDLRGRRRRLGADLFPALGRNRASARGGGDCGHGVVDGSRARRTARRHRQPGGRRSPGAELARTGRSLGRARLSAARLGLARVGRRHRRLSGARGRRRGARHDLRRRRRGRRGNAGRQAHRGAAAGRQRRSSRCRWCFGLLLFYAWCLQCAATLAVIRRETNSWRWPMFAWSYMTTLGYGGALLIYQLGTA